MSAIQTSTTPTIAEPSRITAFRASRLFVSAMGLCGQWSQPVAGVSETSAAARFERIAALPPTPMSQ